MTELSWTDPCFAPVARLLSSRTGLYFRPHNRDGVEQGIRLAMQRSGIASLAAYYCQLQEDADLLDDLIGELTVGETYFFREPEQLDFIRDEVLPELLKRRDPNHVIRVWSAGCASGEEPYTLAILLDLCGLGQRSHILATDVSCEALAKAREAVYPDWSLRGRGKRCTQGYMTQRGDLHKLDEGIRRRVNFEFLNLALDMYPSFVSGTRDLDLILCRNVLIYFDEETVQRIAVNLHACLAEDGWLITAAGDPPLDEFAPYETVLTDAGVVYRRATTPTAHEPSRTNKSAAEQLDDWLRHPEVPASALAAQRPIMSAPTKPNVIREPRAENHDVVGQARRALQEGKYQQAVELTTEINSEEACEIHVQALANIDASRAELVCANAALRHATSASLRYLHAVLLIENNRDNEATDAARRAIYLDRNFVVAHLLLGSLLRRRGDLNEAYKAYRNARRLCDAEPPNATQRMADGETAAQLAEAAQFQLDSIAAILEAP